MLEPTSFVELGSWDYSRLSSALSVFCWLLLNEITSTSGNNVNLSDTNIAEVLPCSSFIPNIVQEFNNHQYFNWL